MNLVVCPHCKSHRIVTARVPKDVVVVMPCPACNELVVLFRKKVIAVDRKVLEEGTMDERKEHLAEIIAEFIEPGMFSTEASGDDSSEEPARPKPRRRRRRVEADADSPPPISEQEIETFTKIQLGKLDDAQYFRKHFG